MKFLFDLDGTVTSQETLPVIANHFYCQEEIADLTKRTIAGNVPFVESFIRRVSILGKYSVGETSKVLGQVPLYHGLHRNYIINTLCHFTFPNTCPHGR